jgi:hypothetical protein
MPSQVHAILVDLFRAAPSLALDLLRATGASVTAAGARVLDSTFPVTSPDYHVDLTLVCDDASGAPGLVVLVEVQLEPDADKRTAWPFHQAAARTRFRCDACVLVLTIKDSVAHWASVPVVLGPCGSIFRAIVLGPASVPHAAPPATPELALLSALAHGAQDPGTVHLALDSMDKLDESRARAYFDLLQYHLGEALHRALEARMTTSEHPYLSDFARRYYDTGKAAGKAEGEATGEAKGEAKGEARGEAHRARAALLTVLTAREVPLADADRARIEACADLSTLDAWLARAARATKVDEVFGG